ncbi:MAG: N-acetyltransferase [Opitutaceae bacterium]|nr:N-acetyltransferase [Opitutaceae bacterium]
METEEAEGNPRGPRQIRQACHDCVRGGGNGQAPLTWLAVPPATAGVIEIDFLLFLDESLCPAERGLSFAHTRWVQGRRAEAASAAAGHMFSSPRPSQFEATRMVENSASADVLRRTGLREEGVLRMSCQCDGRFFPMKLFALLPSDIR